MLEGKCEENRFPKDVEFSPQKKIDVSKSKTRIMKKNQEKWRIKKNEKNER